MAEARRARAPLPSVEGARFLIVEARYYDEIGDMLLTGAVTTLKAADAQVDIVGVPGALEIPYVLDRMAQSAAFDALIALGAVIRGETYHFELVANESGRGIQAVATDYGVPVANAVLTTNTDEQAEERAPVKGAEAARVAVEMACLGDWLDQFEPSEDFLSLIDEGEEK